MYLKVNGTRLFFDVVGSGLQPEAQAMKPKPILIALHGGPGLDHSNLRPLDPLGEVAQVIYLDLRGSGRSARHHHEYYQIGIMADDVVAFCAELAYRLCNQMRFVEKWQKPSKICLLRRWMIACYSEQLARKGALLAEL
jgi:pimeloyl-ACP methyl ester carboxylesterase